MVTELESQVGTREEGKKEKEEGEIRKKEEKKDIGHTKPSLDLMDPEHVAK